jgi:predicted transcriptional regulator
MAALTVSLDQAALDRLRETAERAGVPVEALAESVLTHYLARQPLEFVAIGASRELSAQNVDELLEAGFGR